MSHMLLAALGGAIGAVLRQQSGSLALRLLGPGFPWGTLFVNVFGSLVMGLFIAWLVKRGGSNELRIFFATGLLGGFTTFSAFSLDVANIIERGEMGVAMAYVLASVALSIFAIFTGLWVGRVMV